MTDMPQFNPTNIKGSIREFERWLADAGGAFPRPLFDLALRALLTLRSLDQPNVEKSPAFMAASKKDLADFAAAYAEWKAGNPANDASTTGH